MLKKHSFRSKVIFCLSLLLLNPVGYASATSHVTRTGFSSTNVYSPPIHYEKLNFILIKAPILCAVPCPITLHVIQKNVNSPDLLEIDFTSRSCYKNINVINDDSFIPSQQTFEYPLTNNLNNVLTLNGMRLTDEKTHIKMTAGTWVDNQGCQGTFYSTPVMQHLD